MEVPVYDKITGVHSEAYLYARLEEEIERWRGERGHFTLLFAEVSGVSYDGSTYEFGAPGKRTVLWFYPKANTGG